MRRSLLASFVLALVAAWSAGGAAAQGRVAVWSGWAEDGHGGAVDCTDCAEDEYVSLDCEREGTGVAVELVGLAPGDDATGEPQEVTLDVDGQSETRLAQIEVSEMLGPVPVLMLPKDDPLFARLRSGLSLRLSSQGDSLTIPLAGAAKALDTMFSACN